MNWSGPRALNNLAPEPAILCGDLVRGAFNQIGNYLFDFLNEYKAIHTLQWLSLLVLGLKIKVFPEF